MPITIGSNISSLKALRGLDRASGSLAQSFERLSSGLRINRASDDAAGLSIASSLKSDTRIFSQSIRNINDGISMLNIMEGGLQQLSVITSRQMELAEQAANGVYSFNQRTAMHAEANALVDEYNRITQTTSFNGIKLLDNSTSTITIQAGTGTAGMLNGTIDNFLSRTVGSGTYQTAVSYYANAVNAGMAAADLNKDGKIDLVGSNGNVWIGNGDGTFKTPVSYIMGGSGPQYLRADLDLVDLDGDGNLDIVSPYTNAYVGTNIVVLMGNGDGSFKVVKGYSTGTGPGTTDIADFDGDGKLDVLTSDYGGTISILKGNGDGSFNVRTSIATYTGSHRESSADLNGDGILDLAIASTGDGNISVFFGNGNGTFKAPVSYVSELSAVVF